MSSQGQWQVAGNAAEIYERALVPAVFAPWAPLVVALANPQPGELMLDIAASVAANAPATSASITWREASATKIPLPDATFDIAYCQLGLQFFPDRPAALREMHRLLVPDGRVGVMVWRGIEHSPGFQ